VVLGRDGRIFVSSDPLRFPVGSLSTLLTVPLQNALRLTAVPGAVALGEVTTAENSFSTVNVPLLSDDRELVGTLLMSYSHAIFAQRYRDTVATLAEITAALVAILIPLGWWFGRRLTNPLSRVTDALYRLGTEAARKSSAFSGVPAHAFASSQAPSSELDRLEHALAHLQQQLNEREQLERQFLAADRLAAIGRLTSSVAHEINNPLAGMLNALSNLRLDPAFLSQTVSLLKRGIEQIRQTLSALLIETKTQTRPLSPSDIGDLRLLVQTQARNKRLHLNWSYPIATDLPLPAAPVRRVILNLLLNAIQAAESLVSFSASATDVELTLSIANDGREFPVALRQKPFEPLLEGEGQGHGLGLWASHQLVTSPGRSNRPDVRFRHHGLRRASTVWSVSRACGCCPSCSRNQLMASTICLIEDDDLLGETLCDRFRLEGLEFEWFKEGRRALEALKRRAFAVVLCDLRLPDGSGAEVFEALESTLRPPFVFMTGFGSIDEAVAL